MRTSVLAALLLAVAASTAHADTIGLHVGSWHSEPGFNNVNPGAYWRGDDGWTAGAYCNSQSRSERFPDARRCKVSAYAGRLFDHEIAPGLHVGILAGAVAGYSLAPIIPAAIGTIQYGPARLWLIPRVEKNSAAVVSLSFEFNLPN